MTASPDVSVVVEVGGPTHLRLNGAGRRSRPPWTSVSGHDGLWRAARSPAGPVTVRVSGAHGTVTVDAWGPGASWVGARSRGWAAADDDPAVVEAHHPVVARLQTLAVRHGRRWPRTGLVADPLLAVVIDQKVPTRSARRSTAALLRLLGRRPPAAELAPHGLVLPPDPVEVARLPDHVLHRIGIERARGRRLKEVAARASRCAEAADMATDAATARLTSVRGVGPWSASKVLGRALGDPDVVVVGDYNYPARVAWSLAGERTADDARMLELLAPYAGQRGRVQAWLVSTGARPPRRGPRLSVPDIRAI